MFQTANIKLAIRLVLLALLLVGIWKVNIYSKQTTVKLQDYDIASGKAVYRQLDFHPDDNIIEFLIHFKFSSTEFNPFNTLLQTGEPEKGINVHYDIQNGIIISAPDVKGKRVSSLSRKMRPNQSYKLDIRYFEHRISAKLRNHEVLFDPKFHVHQVDFTSLAVGGPGPGIATLPGTVKEIRAEYTWRPWWSFYVSLLFALSFLILFVESLVNTSLGKLLGQLGVLVARGANSGFREQGYLFWSKIAYIVLAVFLAGLVIMNHL